MKKNDVLVRFATLQSVCNKKKKNGSCLESGCLCREEKCPVVFLRAQDLEDYSDLREISDFAKDIYNTFFDYDLEDVEYYKSKAIIEKQRREDIQIKYSSVLNALSTIKANNTNMTENETINYIPEHTPPFRIFRTKDVKFGAFYASRLLFAYDCEGRAWQENFFAAVVGLMFPAAFVLDLCGIAVWYVCKILYKIFCGVWNLVLKCIEDGFKNSVGVLLKIATIFISLSIIFYKWHEITDFIKGLF